MITYIIALFYKYKISVSHRHNSQYDVKMINDEFSLKKRSILQYSGIQNVCQL